MSDESMAQEPEINMPMPKGIETQAETKKSEIEELAESMGWNPDFEGAEGKEVLSAKDFIKKGRDIQKDMSKRIKSQSEALDDMKNSIKAIQEHNDKVNRAEIKALKSKLEEKKENAIIDGDIEAVKQADKEMEALNDREAEDKKEAREMSSFEKQWNKDNKWAVENPEMEDYANYKLTGFLRKNKDASTKEMLEFAREVTEKKFPEYFGKETKKTPPKTAVNEAGGRPGSNGKSTLTSADLSSDERQIMKQFVRTGIMTEKQYLADLAKIKGIK